jgi:hypothetical protein
MGGMQVGWSVLALLPGLTACSFKVTGVPLIADLASPEMGGAPEMAAPPDLWTVDLAPPACPPLPGLVACYSFEGDVRDSSANGNHATSSTVTYVPGVVGQALALSQVSSVRAPDSASLDARGGLTLETWVFVDVLPLTGRAGLIDNDGQYGLFLSAAGELRCNMTGMVASAPATLTVGAWVHVACTWDGLTIRLYKNGVEIAAAPAAGMLPLGNNEGLALGGNSPSGDALTGKLDELRIWNVGRTAAEVCTAAHVPGC